MSVEFKNDKLGKLEVDVQAVFGLCIFVGTD